MRSSIVLAALALSGCGSFSGADTAPPDSGITEAGASSDGGTTDGSSAPSGPIAHWKLDEVSGGTAKDSVGANDGLVVGEAAFVPGHIGNAFSTTGGTAYVTIPNGAPLAVKDRFTVAMWIAFFSSPNDSHFYSHGAQFWLKLNGRRPQLNVEPGFYVVAEAPVAADQNWHHFAATFDAGTAQLYVDGIDAGKNETAGATSEVGPMTTGISIGRTHFGADAALGSIDDVQVWNRVLSVAEIKQLAAQ